MTDQIVFYTNPMSRGRIVRWMLEEIGKPYQTKIIEYGAAMKSPGYLAINPMGKVPAIRLGESIVTECAAICAFLADVFPEAGLAPPVTARADYYRWLFFAAGPLEAATTNRAFNFELSEEQRPMSGYGSYDDVMDTLEIAVSHHPFIAGDEFSAADVYVGSHLKWGMEFGTMEKRDGFEAYVSRVQDRDAHRRATEIDEAMSTDSDSKGQ